MPAKACGIYTHAGARFVEGDEPVATMGADLSGEQSVAMTTASLRLDAMALWSHTYPPRSQLCT